MQQNHIEALRLLGVYTANSFDPWRLAGPAKASCRAHIMSVFNDKRTPQSKSGVTIIRSSLWGLFDLSGSCQAEREKDFISKAEHVLNH